METLSKKQTTKQPQGWDRSVNELLEKFNSLDEKSQIYFHQKVEDALGMKNGRDVYNGQNFQGQHNESKGSQNGNLKSITQQSGRLQGNTDKTFEINQKGTNEDKREDQLYPRGDKTKSYV